SVLVRYLHSFPTRRSSDLVSGNDDGTLSVSDLKDSSGVPKKFREIAPLLFREVNGQDKVGFKRDETGNFVEAIDFPFMVFQKASLNQNSAFQIPMIITEIGRAHV